ncbi:hypothetical protein [Kiloniella sp.]|uniref:hypothetical protein n=1 Tax=Kiloniella sp. TaxID=1938587 RepID=UPI003A93DD8E
MKYVIEKNGILVSSISAWTPGLAKKCNLVGNNQPPQSLPFDLGEGATLRTVRIVRVSPTPYQLVIDNGGALVGGEWVITQSLQDKTVEQIAAQKRDKVNAEAARRIEDIAPLWKQVRGSERAIELIEIKSARPWSTVESNEATFLRQKRHEIEAIRKRSNLLISLSDRDLANTDIFDDGNWSTP